MATIRMSMREKSVEPEEIIENPSLSTAVDRSVAGFFGVMAAVVVGFGYLIPVAVLVLVVWFVVRQVRRQRTA
jgi:type IV secretory pathway TrbD component